MKIVEAKLRASGVEARRSARETGALVGLGVDELLQALVSVEDDALARAET